MVLEVDRITKDYGNNRGAIDISFNIGQGEIFGLLGPNGSGKTTIMKMITGLIKPKEGNIRILGYDVVEKTGIALKEVGSLIEVPASIPYLSAYKNLKSVARFYEKPFNIDKVLSIVGLSQVQDDIVKKFSLGMKQRLGIAMAIIGAPKLLVLDEPTNGLDIELTVSIRELIIELSKNGTTVIISSHLAIELEKMCTMVGIIKDARIINIERMENVLKNYNDLEDYYISNVKNVRNVKNLGGEM